MPENRQPEGHETRKCNHTLQFAVGGLLHCLLDLVVGNGLLETAGKVNDRDIRSGYTHRHASELAIQAWDDFADGLRGTSAAGNNVLSSSAAASPVLGGWAIDGLLSSGVRVDCGHQTLNDGVVIVHDLGERSKAVRCARCVGNNLDVGLIGLLVNAHDEHGSVC